MTGLTSALIFLALAAEPPINPYPPMLLPSVELVRWDFQTTDDWKAENHCTLGAKDGSLVVRSTGDDPYFHRRLDLPGGPLVFQMRARCRGAGDGQLFWTTDREPARDPARSQGFPLVHDGAWHEFQARFTAPGRLRDLRIDPGSAPGEFEIDWIRLVQARQHPLEIAAVSVDKQARFTVRSHAERELRFSANGRPYSAAAGGTVEIDVPIPGKAAVEAVTLELTAADGPAALPSVRRTALVPNPNAAVAWIAVPMEGAVCEVSPDGLAVRVRRGDQVAAMIAPTLHFDGRLPVLAKAPGPGLRFEGEGAALSLEPGPKGLKLNLISKKPCEGPVVRALGSFEGGVLAGVEYLGRGDRSSSRLDCENEQHLRFTPDPMKVTFPYMSLVTDRGAVAMIWRDTGLQPTYAVPNFFDGTSDQRMGLKGTKIEAEIYIDRVRVEETIAWAVRRHGLPEPPKPPRTVDEQWKLCMRALSGPPLKNKDGWGHCAEDHWKRHPFADHISTIWRLTGRMPEYDHFVAGGSHVPNEAIYFVTGRAAEWKKRHEAQAAGLIAQQRPDGSYHYDGPFARGHFEDTANGVCARPAAMLLEYARVTGDKKALEAGLRTLDYMKRFDVPRGAQVWEVPLHTPDQLASAYGVWAYVRGFELTGKPEYLAEARRWALSGVPFTYLWTCKPIMLYATPPVLGATNWQAPMWIGLPVQWVGGVYAYALTMLASHDKTLDWNRLARGILNSAEQQQFPDGQWAGLLPDSVTLASQARNPWRINPCALVSLRMVLDGQVDYLAVGSVGNPSRRVASPFPLAIKDGKAIIQGRKGLKYQILVDGNVVDIASQGQDLVPLR